MIDAAAMTAKSSAATGCRAACTLRASLSRTCRAWRCPAGRSSAACRGRARHRWPKALAAALDGVHPRIDTIEQPLPEGRGHGPRGRLPPRRGQSAAGSNRGGGLRRSIADDALRMESSGRSCWCWSRGRRARVLGCARASPPRGIAQCGYREADAADAERRAGARTRNNGRNLRLTEKMDALAEVMGITRAQLALAWVLHPSRRLIVPIPGTRSASDRHSRRGQRAARRGRHSRARRAGAHRQHST